MGTKTDNFSTKSVEDQIECETSCQMFLSLLSQIEHGLLPPDQLEELQRKFFLNSDHQVLLMRQKHTAYLLRALEYLPSGFGSLDASRPWIIYWVLHSLELMEELPILMYPRCIETLRRCWNAGGGYGGGPLQIGHCATTYATCLAIAVMGTSEAYDSVDRKALHSFFLARKDPVTGGFTAHDNGEVDVRMTYCVISIASLFNILSPDLIDGTAEYVLKCQTYEGGFGGEPGNESHGGYAFCAVATLYILNKLQLADLSNLMHWISFRQMSVEGGYQGRTNKLVDGCYSHWQGAIPVLISTFLNSLTPSSRKTIFPTLDSEVDDADFLLCNRLELQKYILVCGQQMEGGLRDKPGKPRDHYHTCYCLSGLALSQHGDGTKEPIVFGDNGNLLAENNPAYNISQKKVELIQEYFLDKKI